jgi:aspartyl-tRNA(Asn)/glutamyl-tRNA(Gln) amidotransferase subunit B
MALLSLSKNMKYIPTIGLEIHAELKTQSKMFCSCANNPDEKRPNVNICPICLGHPGTLPVLNKQAIQHVLLVGHAVGGKIADYTEWDRKNYFYPDIPKGYQISQYKYPLVTGGAIPIYLQKKTSGLLLIAITRIHLEEDTAKSTHGQGKSADESLVDFNRAGVPLLELVTEPVIHDAETAGAFAREFQLLLRTLGVAEANMEKGELRVEANVSVASEGDTAAGRFGTKTEVKNLNSFRSVERAIAFEIKRQIELLEKGEQVIQETRGWDENAGKTFSQRAKESSHDYRYFPDPDLPKLVISEIPEFSAEEIKKAMPELPWDKRARLIKDFKMTEKEAAVFIENDFLAAYFDQTIAFLNNDPKKVRLFINYLLTDYTALLKERLGNSYLRLDTAAIMPKRFVELINMISSGDLSSAAAKMILAFMIDEKDASPKILAEKHGLLQKSDTSELENMVKEIIAKNPSVVADYKAGKLVALQFLIGQGMKLSKGSANPEVLKEVFLKELK